MGALYEWQKVPLKNNAEKIELLRSLMGGGFIPDHFDSEDLERKAYEFVYLDKIGLIKE